MKKRTSALKRNGHDEGQTVILLSLRRDVPAPGLMCPERVRDCRQSPKFLDPNLGHEVVLVHGTNPEADCFAGDGGLVGRKAVVGFWI